MLVNSIHIPSAFFFCLFWSPQSAKMSTSLPLCLSILLLLAMNDISSGQLMSLFLTVVTEESFYVNAPPFFLERACFSRSPKAGKCKEP